MKLKTLSFPELVCTILVVAGVVLGYSGIYEAFFTLELRHGEVTLFRKDYIPLRSLRLADLDAFTAAGLAFDQYDVVQSELLEWETGG